MIPNEQTAAERPTETPSLPSTEATASYRRQDLSIRKRVFAMSAAQLEQVKEDQAREESECSEADKFDKNCLTRR